jgi:hypothetical protein
MKLKVERFFFNEIDDFYFILISKEFLILTLFTIYSKIFIST